jgi:hypothetical protein
MDPSQSKTLEDQVVKKFIPFFGSHSFDLFDYSLLLLLSLSNTCTHPLVCTAFVVFRCIFLLGAVLAEVSSFLAVEALPFLLESDSLFGH